MIENPIHWLEPQTLSLRAFAKINLALDLLGVREDGYTEIATVFQSIGWHDRVAVTIHPQPGPIELTVLGADLGPVQENLCWRAAQLFRQSEALTHSISVELIKQIPAGGGLGGGSSDAAAVLWALAELTGRQETVDLVALASALGADVPYFLELGTALGEGRGDRLTRCPDLPRFPLVLAALGPPLATADVFRRARGALTAPGRPPKIARLLNHLQGAGTGLPPVWNDLTKAAVELRPEIDRLLRGFAELGGKAAMSGSGCVVFGLFEDESTATAAARAVQTHEPAAWVRQTWTLPRDAALAQRRISLAG